LAPQSKFTGFWDLDCWKRFTSKRFVMNLICVELSINAKRTWNSFTMNKVIKDQRIDLLVEDNGDRVVVDLKSLSKLPDVATAQLLSYLKATKLNRGLLINFGEKRLVDGVRRISL
jgi:GxxExxY protein